MLRSSQPKTTKPEFCNSNMPRRSSHTFSCQTAWRRHFMVFLIICLALLDDNCQGQSTSPPLNSPEPTTTTKQAVSDGKLTVSDKTTGASNSLQSTPKPPEFRTASFRGKVVWLNEVLKERFGISTVPEAAQRSLAILTDDGSLLPILDDPRGRSFRTDPRLREMRVELFVRQYSAQPMLQIIRVYELLDGQKYEVDYWCDVCAIIMFETGPCACCQDDNRLRKRIVEK